MKTRLANKILRQQPEWVDGKKWHPYWTWRWVAYNECQHPSTGIDIGFRDHRIRKAVTIKYRALRELTQRRMTRAELRNTCEDGICSLCKELNDDRDRVLSFRDACEGRWCVEAEDAFAEENNIKLED